MTMESASPERIAHLNRRDLLRAAASSVGALALGSTVLSLGAGAMVVPPLPSEARGALTTPHVLPRARRVIFLFQSGGPSQIDLFDPKPVLRARHGEELPRSVRGDQRLTTMTSSYETFTCVGSPFRFTRHGESGASLSELLPHTASIVDDLCIILSMHTDPINHDPAVTFLQTGSQLAGKPSMGSWLAWALGSENADLPAYVVLVSGTLNAQAIIPRYWSSGFLPSQYQGVQFQGSGDPVLYLSNPPGISQENRDRIVDTINALNRLKLQASGDPEIETRMRSFDLARKMQTVVPSLLDLSQEPDHVQRLYGPEVTQPGTFAANCLLARRLCERGVRFVQLFHRDWDHHGKLAEELPIMCRETDQPAAGLIKDLKQRGLLDDTLVVWGGEFGRTCYGQGTIDANFGRDHHPRCFTMWMAGGGIRSGLSYGKTDDFSYNIVENPVHIHDFQATVLHCLGLDHERLTFPDQGRDFRLTDVGGTVVSALLS